MWGVCVCGGQGGDPAIMRLLFETCYSSGHAKLVLRFEWQTIFSFELFRLFSYSQCFFFVSTTFHTSIFDIFRTDTGFCPASAFLSLTRGIREDFGLIRAFQYSPSVFNTIHQWSYALRAIYAYSFGATRMVDAFWI